jgi:Fur family zinc uptake transcriptional regulator
VTSSEPVSAEARPALARAERRCRERGVRLTDLRRAVLGIVLDSPRPLGAYEILDILRERTGRSAPPTVYRALEFLLEQGLIHRLHTRNAFMACDQPEHRGGQFLICQQCGGVTELVDPNIADSLSHAAREAGFAVSESVVEVAGRCRACRREAGGDGQP